MLRIVLHKRLYLERNIKRIPLVISKAPIVLKTEHNERRIIDNIIPELFVIDGIVRNPTPNIELIKRKVPVLSFSYI